MPVNNIARFASSAAAMTSSSRIDPPGWMTAVAPASTAASKPSANGKKASDATAEPSARAVLRVNDGIRFDVLGDGPGEQAVGDFLFGRLPFGHALELVARDDAVVAVLNQQTTGDP